MPLISATLLCCEKILNEEDVFSAIRLSEVFVCPPLPPGVLPERAFVEVHILAMAKFNIEDEGTHTAELFLIRPDGETIPLGIQMKSDLSTLTPKIPVAPRGLTILAQFAVLQKQMGVHYFILKVDKEEVARCVFTLHRVSVQGANDEAQNRI